MKKALIVSFAVLLIILSCAAVPKGLGRETDSASYSVTTVEAPINYTTSNSSKRHFPAPESILNELPANASYYLNTTNQYAQISTLTDEVNEAEGSNPVYVLIFVDEEEQEYIDWKEYAELQLERADDSLVAQYGIDIRILGFEPWDSDNSKTHMEDLTDEFLEENGYWLGQWFDGEYWHDYVDLIAGLTAQATPGDIQTIYGLGPTPPLVDEGKSFIFLKWTNTYWRDDNLPQHEFSHNFYANDHLCHCCVMAYHKHYQSFILEDGNLFVVLDNVECVFTSYTWCSDCCSVINTYKGLYSESSNVLIIRHGDPYNPKCTFLIKVGSMSEPIDPGVQYFYTPVSFSIGFTNVNAGYHFLYWLIDGTQKKYTPTIPIYTSGKHTIAAYFRALNPPHRPYHGYGGFGKDALIK